MWCGMPGNRQEVVVQSFARLSVGVGHVTSFDSLGLRGLFALTSLEQDPEHFGEDRRFTYTFTETNSGRLDES